MTSSEPATHFQIKMSIAYFGTRDGVKPEQFLPECAQATELIILTGSGYYFLRRSRLWCELTSCAGAKTKPAAT